MANAPHTVAENVLFSVTDIPSSTLERLGTKTSKIFTGYSGLYRENTLPCQTHDRETFLWGMDIHDGRPYRSRVILRYVGVF